MALVADVLGIRIARFGSCSASQNPTQSFSWIMASQRWNHVNYSYNFGALPPYLRRRTGRSFRSGAGTPGSPFWCQKFGGQCTVTSRAALSEVGFLDPRFIGYGFEHVEWSWRFWCRYHAEWGSSERAVPCLSRGLDVTWPPSFFNRREYWVNALLYARLRIDSASPYRLPWKNLHERRTFEAEVAAAVASPLVITSSPIRPSGLDCDVT
jgi:hypothetical protein